MTPALPLALGVAQLLAVFFAAKPRRRRRKLRGSAANTSIDVRRVDAIILASGQAHLAEARALELDAEGDHWRAYAFMRIARDWQRGSRMDADVAYLTRALGSG